MNWGLKVQGQSGGIQFSPQAFGGAVVDLRTIVGWTSGVVQYPDFAGKTLFAFMEPSRLIAYANPSYHVWSVSTPAGIPTLSWDYDSAHVYPKGLDIPLIVFVR